MANPCARCDSPLVEIGIEQHGQRFLMQSCSECDTRTWRVDGRTGEIDAVLDSLRDPDTTPLEPTAI